MKVWVTRPECVEVYMGGLRSVDVWVEKPFFDQRPIKHDFDLYCRKSKQYFAEVYRENGWYTQTGRVRAKRFLKQDPAIKEKVWALIQESLVYADCADPQRRLNNEEYDELLNLAHEMKCRIHWKRFLLELDLRAETVKVIEPEVLLDERQPRANYPITLDTGTTSSFLDQDLARPYHREAYSQYEVRRDNLW